MTTIDQAKTMAKKLRASLAARDIDLPHSAALELVAAQLGYDDWNIAAARLDAPPEEGIAFDRAVPVLRIFDEAKAREFYCDWLGFCVDQRYPCASPRVERQALHLWLPGNC